MRKSIWNIKKPNEEIVYKISAEYNLPIILSKLLVNRGIIEEEQIERYLYPTSEKLYSPFLLKDMEEATERILLARNNNEKITIYGDYDVDGITSTSILYMFLDEIGCAVDYYIPDRIDEGYGLNFDAIEIIYNLGTDLIITVDTGIVAVNEVEETKKMGMDIIITDHHECQDILPQASAVINPKRNDCNYPFDMLAGVGVTFKLIHGLAIKLGIEDNIWKYLDIVAIGTIADIVPLCDENRILVKLAFNNFINTNNIGLKAMMDVVGVEKEINASIIGYRIAPRLNASGRLGDAKRGVELLISKDIEQVKSIALDLNNQNNKRQEIEQEIFKEAIEIIEKDKELLNSKVIVVSSIDWHHGVIGIVASRIVEKYYRPVIILNIEDVMATGSARSVEGFNIFEALNHCKHLLEKFGGHNMAAGMSLKEENIKNLFTEINKYCNEIMTEETLIPKKNADIELSVDDITISLVNELKKMEPYGAGNEEPKIICSGNLKDIKTIGKNANHLKIVIEDMNRKIDCVGFNIAEYSNYIGLNNRISLLGTLDLNTWNNNTNPQILVKDIKYENKFENIIKGYIQDIKNITNEKISKWKEESINLTRKEFEIIYRFMKGLDFENNNRFSLLKTANILGRNSTQEVLKILIILEVFKELELLIYSLDENYIVKFDLFKGKKVELNSSKLYNKICII